MTLLSELLNCHEYVNADAIAEKKLKSSWDIVNQTTWDKLHERYAQK